MSYTDNKVFNVYINSANRSPVDKSYDFNIYFDNDEINANPNEGINVNVVSFSLLNSMYNVNQYTGNNKFILLENESTNTIITIPYGNYSVYSFMDKLNELLTGKMQVSYNIATNTYTYKNIGVGTLSIIPQECKKLLGLNDTTPISSSGTISISELGCSNFF
jgi:hypothetical protein